MEDFNFDSLQKSVHPPHSVLLKIVFRLMELCFGVFLLTRSSVHLSFAVRVSGEYLRQLVAFIVNPIVVFAFSNFILLTLFLNSGLSPVTGNDSGNDLYESLIENTIYGCNDFDLVPMQDEIVPEVSRTGDSETENCRRNEDSGEIPAEEAAEAEVEELSNEEFQRAIEEFIAKQNRFHREEKSAIVVHSQA